MARRPHSHALPLQRRPSESPYAHSACVYSTNRDEQKKKPDSGRASDRHGDKGRGRKVKVQFYWLPEPERGIWITKAGEKGARG